MGLSRAVSEIDGDFRRKLQQQKINPRVFNPPPSLTGLPLEFGIVARGQKTRIMGLPDGRKSFKIGLAV